MSKKKEVSTKALMERKQVTAYLQDLINCMNDGKLVIQQGSESVTLSPSDIVEVEVEASQKKEKEKFSLELSWKTTPQIVPGTAGLTISSDEPEEDKTEENK